MKPAILLIGVLSIAMMVPLSAQETSPAAAAHQPAVVDLDTVLVTGSQPGPGMWKVSKGDHVLWILGTLTPLPKHMQWQSDEVREAVAQAQAIIQPPSVTVDSDIGMFRGLMLLPSMLKMRKNPEGKNLRDVVSPELYARWSVLKARYIGGDRGVESWRPVFAAQELYEAAIRKSGMSQSGVVQPVIKAASKESKPVLLPANIKVTVKDPKPLIKEFNAGTLDDGDCFAKTLGRIETDLEGMKQRANAWAEGDIEALRNLPYENQYAACMQAMAASSVAKKLGMTDINTRMDNAWLASADSALDKYTVSFATLPMGMLIRPGNGNYLDKLRARGYEVEEP